MRISDWSSDVCSSDLADFFFARFGVGLAGFVEGHHHHGGTVALAQLGVVDELLDAFLHADGVDDALALDALEARFDHRPEERRVGKEWVSTGRSRWSPDT